MNRNDIGVIGLGVMGANLARNMARNQYVVSGYDVDSNKVGAFSQDHGSLIGFGALNDFISSLRTPRQIILLVPDRQVDNSIEMLVPLLDKHDAIIDMGNSFFKDTERRTKYVEESGLLFIGSGVSGGEYGALHGPCIMPGGHYSAYQSIEPLLQSIAAKVDNQPCVAHIGPRGAGHYVKMIHNGIEYGIMQLIAEIYAVLQLAGNASAEELHQLFQSWNETELNSYLIEITASIFSKIDEETQKPLIDVILDDAEQKGTGKWTCQNALDLGIATPTINAAVEARIISSFKKQRELGAKHLPISRKMAYIDKDQLFDAARQTLYSGVLCCFAQGISLMQAASREYDYQLSISTISTIWRGGCIIRAGILNDIAALYSDNPDIDNLMFSDRFGTELLERHQAFQTFVKLAVDAAVPIPALTASLSYFDAFRTERLPANLIQAQRDYFGSHTYRRIGKPGSFHTNWYKA
ncbi:MAG: NADP-dependent phosphogluconate dehydrogenase [Anaerolineae bacterium]|nr:NADP-dependent phosphogluconate dehydrogenase [Anaerolineae bacterium]NUQ03908.1 NADP-dependent phosphogluconate dehydrogenase [Anaerolineae bacterium]